jgi:NAD(P)-dependent dehydrogenase (short-subunit alcohol dehydrogenase family)
MDRDMPPTLQNQIALVSGASRGIGRAISLALAKCGAHVLLVSRASDHLHSLHHEITSANLTATPLPTDLTSEPQILSLFDHINATFGHLDILINNAGIGIFGPTPTFSTADFDRILATNVRAPFLCCREALKLMIPRKTGTILNISSVVGIKGYLHQAAYTASKHALMGLTKSLALECQPHSIRVSAILPGGVDTDLAGDARPDLDRSLLLTPDDIANTVLYLLSLSPRAAIDQIYIRRRSSSPF